MSRKSTLSLVRYPGLVHAAIKWKTVVRIVIPRLKQKAQTGISKQHTMLVKKMILILIQHLQSKTNTTSAT